MEMTRRCSDVPWPVRVSIVALTIGLTVGMTGCLDGAASVRPAGDRVSLVGTPGAASTGRADLVATIDAMRARLRARPRDPEAAVGLAGALLRQARVVADAALAVEAEGALRDALDVEPAHYPERRMLGAVLLSQHRFHAAREVAEDAMGVNARDAWNHAVIGDASFEVGDYAQAFDAYDRMMTLRPSADAYARVAHAHEIQGELDRALATMTMAAEATSAHDPEGQAWARVQVGHLMFQLGRLDEAEREYRHAMHIFPEHPYARAGLARLAVARGEYHRALAAYESLMRDVPTPEWAAWIGDLRAALGDARAAEAAYEHAEQLEREGWANEEPQYAALARFLAQRNRRVDEAVRLAERGAGSRRDVATLDALAWSYYRAGRLADARVSAEAALESGTRDRTVLYHAAAIRYAMGDEAAARALVSRAVGGHGTFDLANAPAAVALLARLDSGA